MATATTAPKAPNPWWVGVVSGMASYIDACAIVSASTAFTIYQAVFGLTNGQLGMLTMSLALGIAAGSLAGGPLGDRFGRKHVFSATMVMIMIGSALLSLATGFTGLLVGAIVVGLGTGADLPVSLATIAEAATDDNRGKIVLLSNILWTLGILGAVALSSVVGDWGRQGGQIMFTQIGIVALVTFLARLTIPESDSWLRARAERAGGAGTVRADRARVRDLVTGPYAKPLYALVLFYSLVNIAANTGGSYNTWVAVNLAGMQVSSASQIGLLAIPASFIFAIWSMRIIDTPKRMPYFYAGAAVFTVSLLIYPLLGFSSRTFTAFILINMIGSAFAFEGMMKVWAQESFPTLLRATAQGTVIAIARVVAALTAGATPILLAANARLFYVGLTAVVAIGYAFAIWGFHGAQRNEFAAEAHDEEDAAAGEEVGPDAAGPDFGR